MPKEYDGNCTQCGAEGFEWVVKEPNNPMQFLCGKCNEELVKETCEVDDCNREAVAPINNHEGDTLMVCAYHERKKLY